MDSTQLLAVAERNGGYFTRGQALDCGYSDRDLREATRAGFLTRLRHGTYALTSAYSILDASGRHRVRARSVVDKLGPGLALSHTSACAAWELDHFGTPLETVHVTRLDGATGRREAGVTYHVGAIDESEVREVDGRLIVHTARAVVEHATISSIESAMVCTSSALRMGVTTEAELVDTLQPFGRWQGGRKASIAIGLSDGLCETVGEVRSLHLCWREALPRPELQYRVTTASGIVVARTDFAWPDHRHLGEFDGLVKYGRLNPYTDDPGRAITDEKLREDLARAQQFGMSRWVWAGLDTRRAAATANAIRAGMELSKTLYLRNRTTIVL